MSAHGYLGISGWEITRSETGLAFSDPQGAEVVLLATQIAPSGAVSAVFAAPPEACHFGLGQHQDGALDHTGRTVQLWHEYDAPTGEVVAMPFLVVHQPGTGTCGLLWPNLSRTQVQVACQGRTVWESEAGGCVSFVLVRGPSPGAVYQAYRAATGTTPLPPRAALGYIQ